MLIRLHTIAIPTLLLIGWMPGPVGAQMSGTNSERIEELARQLETTQSQLDATQALLQELRQQAGPESRPAESPVVQQLPPVDYSSRFASHTLAGSDQNKSCPGCGEAVCPGVPKLCQSCQEQQSWNKGAFRIVPYGAVVGEMIGSNISPQLRGSPLFLVPGPAPGVNDSRFTTSAQQSAIGVLVTGPDLGNFSSGANVLVNFFGERPIQNNPGLFALLAWGELKNEDWRLWIGQDGDGIGRQNTNSPAWSSHKQSGNFGQLRPGFRAERFLQHSDVLSSSVYFGLTQQGVNDFIALPGVAGIDNGWPNVEARWETTFGPADNGPRPFLLAVGGMVGETRAIDTFAMFPGNVSTSWAVIPELRIESERWGFQGECFAGQAMGTYNGAIGQSLNPNTGDAIYSMGGFGELFWKVKPGFTTSVGYGIDDPRDSDLGTIPPGGRIGQRARNEKYWLNFIWKLSDEWETRFEVSHLETTYIGATRDSASMIYHALVRFSF